MLLKKIALCCSLLRDLILCPNSVTVQLAKRKYYILIRN